MTENAMYQSADVVARARGNDNIYAKPTKKIDTAAGAGNVYAVVNKPGKHSF